ncbi:hypothetical protein Bbelb_174830 [Branchiostoma belcheri]|nr:hypothetical protein Bbelb_174830 [Branchiostoma belcheri]
MADNFKENARNNYSRKYKLAHRDNVKNRPKPPAVLENSRCRDCLGDYDKKALYEGACVCHSGFLVALRGTSYSRWTCCNVVSDASTPTYQEHKDTGCSTGRHFWQPHRKSSAGHRRTHKRRALAEEIRDSR